MSRVHFRNPEVRLSVALEATRQAVAGHQVTLREILSHVGEQGLLVFCAILAMPFLFPMSLPGMSTALGAPMLLIGYAVTMNRTPWLPDRLLDHALPTATVQHVLERAVHAADRFEHLVRPRLLGLTGTPGVNVINGVVLILIVLALMAPLPLIPLANTLPGIAIILLCLGMAERDGWLLLGGHFVALVSLLYVGLLLYFAVKLGSDPRAALEAVQQLMARALGH
jgi:hypothetical protein